jgi:hypothetical protein
MLARLLPAYLSATSRVVIGLLLLVLLRPSPAASQRYATAHIRAKADSVLRARVGAAVFAYAQYDSLSYYGFSNLAGHKKYANFTRQHTKGRFLEGEVHYNIRIPYPNCPAFDTIKGFSGVRFDQQLHVVGEPYMGFIPAFYWTGQSCQLLAARQALAIAQQLPLKLGIRPPVAVLDYNAETKTFTWSVLNYLSEGRNYEHKPTGEVEEVLIDAVTGLVKAQQVYVYGGP